MQYILLILETMTTQRWCKWRSWRSSLLKGGPLSLMTVTGKLRLSNGDNPSNGGTTHIKKPRVTILGYQKW